MAAIAGRRTQIGVKEFGGDVDVPYDDTAQLMYYLNCKYTTGIGTGKQVPTGIGAP